jgi:hypothetical protein
LKKAISKSFKESRRWTNQKSIFILHN